MAKRKKPDTRNLPVKLTQDELDKKRDKLAELVRARSLKDQEKKDVAKAFADELKKMDTCISQTAKEIRNREEFRDVEVSEEKDFRLNQLNVVRQDTGETVENRPLRPDERQEMLVYAQF